MVNSRYIPHTAKDTQVMLEAIGVSQVEDLLTSIPSELRRAKITEPKAVPEAALLERYEGLSRHGEVKASFLGAGLYQHSIPTAVDSLISRGEFFTAYTPYQPEAAQGTLQAIFEFQTVVSELMGLDVANASMYDGASAAAEAVLMAVRSDPKRRRVILDPHLQPDVIEVIRTYVGGMDVKIELGASKVGRIDQPGLTKQLSADLACVVVQNPNCLGLVESLAQISQVVRGADAKLVVVVLEPTSLGLLASPGSCGADIAVGEGTGIGNAPNFGGPGVGLLAAREAFLRQMPGRLVGETVDADGRLGYVLTLATREQHIRREKATSNICTNNGLSALAFTIHAALLGPVGLKELAKQCASRARYLVSALAKKGIKRRYMGPYYNEVVIDLGDRVSRAIDIGLKRGVVVGFDLGRWRAEWQGGLLIAVSEHHSRSCLDELAEILVESRA